MGSAAAPAALLPPGVALAKPPPGSSAPSAISEALVIACNAGAVPIVQTLLNLANNLPFIGGFLPAQGTRTKRESGRAAGGPVTGGQQYMVGERGPELFVPNQSGSIVPNNALGGQINVTVQAGAFLGSSDDAREFARRIYGALNDEAKRRGTVLGGAR
jgi:hypothetical protein